MKRTLLISSACLFPSLWMLSAGDPGGGEWPMWGGTPDRNMVSPMKGLPTTWDIKSKKNVKWMGELGSQSYGNPVVAGGQVYVGTNNELMRNPKEGGDRGVLMCFRESDGKFLWQHTNEKLAAGRANDWPYQGVCSSPLVEGDKVYYVSNRAELVCLDAKGDGNGGAKVLWKFDMMEEVGAQPHNMANSSPVSYGDLIYISTSNGQDESHVHVPSPRAPSIIAVSKKTGKLVWEDNSVGEKILHGQWASAAVAKIGDTVQVIHPQGDGWVRSYEAESGKKLWEFDTNPKDSVWPKTRNETISTPVVVDGVVYVANGQDPEHGEGIGNAVCVDGDGKVVWSYDKINRSLSSGAAADGLYFVPDYSGFVYCFDAKTGALQWRHDTKGHIRGSPLLADGKLYVGNEDGYLTILPAKKELKKEEVVEIDMGAPVLSTPVAANGTLYVQTHTHLFAVGATGAGESAGAPEEK
jgi:outer membrane protein assembly factor BamB